VEERVQKQEAVLADIQARYFELEQNPRYWSTIRMKSTVFRDVQPCSLVKVHWCCRGTLVYLYQTTQHPNLEDNSLHSHCHEDVKSNDHRKDMISDWLPLGFHVLRFT
jgi:hypothetical protein